MTTPALAFGLRRHGRQYPWPPQYIGDLPTNQWGSVNPEDIPDGLTPLPSVTNVLGVLDKPALKGWAAEQALRSLYESDAIPTDVDQAIAAHKYAYNRTARDRADAGTRAHTIAERLTTDLPLPTQLSEEDEAYADAFLNFWTDHDPHPQHVEATVYNPEVGYAGTGDLHAIINERPVLIDYKTRGQRPSDSKLKKYGLLYDENRAQLAALTMAPLVAIPDPDADGGWRTIEAPPVVEAWGVVLLPDGGYLTEALRLPEIERWYRVFCGALQAWRGLNDEGAAA